MTWVAFSMRHCGPHDASKGNLAKTIVVPLERGIDEVRDENQTGDY
jgi:hypothetical protein